jgi:hypothetical protein
MSGPAGVRVDLLLADEARDGVSNRVRVDAQSWRDLPAEVQGADGVPVSLHLEHCTEEGGLRGCLACGHPELYTRKDFPPALGIAIVVVAAALVPLTPRDWRPYYPSLVAAAVIDYLLLRVAPDVVLCYVCSSLHRGFGAVPRHPRFDRTIEERLRYGERAVMGSEMRAGGTADAPEPEH